MNMLKTMVELVLNLIIKKTNKKIGFFHVIIKEKTKGEIMENKIKELTQLSVDSNLDLMYCDEEKINSLIQERANL